MSILYTEHSAHNTKLESGAMNKVAEMRTGFTSKIYTFKDHRNKRVNQKNKKKLWFSDKA
jgi:hypothetical protein